VSEIDASRVEATWREVARLPPSRVPAEMQRASREQPDLLAFVLGATEGLPRPVSELAGYIYFVIWRAFRDDTKGRIPQVKAGAIQRTLARNEKSLSGLDGEDPTLLAEALVAQTTRQPALVAYLIEALSESESDKDDPVLMSEEERGTLFVLLKTAIDVLDEAREGPADVEESQ